MGWKKTEFGLGWVYLPKPNTQYPKNFIPKPNTQKILYPNPKPKKFYTQTQNTQNFIPKPKTHTQNPKKFLPKPKPKPKNFLGETPGVYANHTKPNNI